MNKKLQPIQSLASVVDLENCYFLFRDVFSTSLSLFTLDFLKKY